MNLSPEHFLTRKKNTKGSALLLTLLVVSLLMVLVLSFVVFVRLELRETVNRQQLKQAQANAKMGAILALAELQKTMGPDMRISARADILSDENPDNPDTGVSPFDADQTLRFWTGAWTSEEWDPGDPDDRQGRFLRWLASMPESAAKDIETVRSLDVSNDEFFTTLAKILAEPSSGGSPGDTEVRAALLPIPAVSVSDGSVYNSGNYAWWVSDEGVKANPAQPDPYSGAADASDIEDGNFDAEIPRFLYPSHLNLSLTEWFGNLDRNASYAEELNRNLEKASGLFGSAGLALQVAATDIVNNNDVKATLLEDNIFADYSFFSQGVLSSTRRGGLRGDLSLAFWQDAGTRYPIIKPNDTSRTDSNQLFEENFRLRRIYSPIDYDDMTQRGGGAVGDLNPFGPRWEVLRDFHNSFQKVTTDSDGYQVVRAASSDLTGDTFQEIPRLDNGSLEAHQHDDQDIVRRMGNVARDIDEQSTNPGRGHIGFKKSGGVINNSGAEYLTSPVYPVLTRFVMEFRGRLVKNPDHNDPLQPVTYRPEVQIGIFITLWNPYNIPISLANNNGTPGGENGKSDMHIHFTPDDLGIFEIEIDGETWSVGGGRNDEISGDYESLIPKFIKGTATKGQNKGNVVETQIGRFLFTASAVRPKHPWESDSDRFGTNPLVNSDFEPGEVRVYALDKQVIEPTEFEDYEGGFGSSLGEMTSYFTSVDVAGTASFRNVFKKKLGFWGTANTNLGYPSGSTVPFKMKMADSSDKTPQFNTVFSSATSNALPQRPITTFIGELDATQSFQQQAVSTDGEAVPLGYVELVLKSGNPYDPRGDALEDQTPRFTHNNPRPWVARNDNTPYSLTQSPNYWLGVVPEGDRSNYTDTVRTSKSVRSSLKYHRGYWGPDHLPGGGRNFVSLFDVPRRPVESMGQYQHAYLSWLANQPAYAFGNSLADIHVPTDGVIARYDDGPNNDTVTYMDLSWFLNDSLWDDYFLSTIDPYVPTGTRLRPQRSRFVELDNTVVYNRGDSSTPATETDYRTAAGNLLLRGAFNVNSTSVEAWKAVIAGLGSDGIPYLDPTKTVADETTGALAFPYHRMSLPLGPENEAWTGGPRDLTEAQMNALAESIVDQVKRRGPFLSISDFVNRRIERSSDDRAIMGALQAAIEAQDSSLQNLVEEVGEVAFIGEAPRYWNENLPDSIKRKPLAFAPGDLTQADILTTIGPLITARSDTFIIRSYGSILSPSSNTVASEAWCEVIVQRTPEALEADPSDPYTAGPFGRSFRIIGFRYLSPEEI